MDDLRDVVLRDLPKPLVVASDNRGGHVFDGTPADNLVLRILRPTESSLTPSRDYTHGQSASALVLAALDRTIAALTTTYGANPADWRDPHPRSTVDSLTGVVGPSRTMPYQDRGSWIQVIDFDAVAAPASPGGGPKAGGRPLPATGGDATAGLAALLLLAGGWALRRRLS
jgi:hypothetical protein